MPPIVVHGDLATFEANFGAATVITTPTPMVATGRGKSGGPAVCVVGDQGQIVLQPCSYFTGEFPVAGWGIVTIASLDPAQQAGKASSGGKALILATGKFNAKFQVVMKAQAPPAPPAPPVFDQTPSYDGKGEFKVINRKSKAT